MRNACVQREFEMAVCTSTKSLFRARMALSDEKLSLHGYSVSCNRCVLINLLMAVGQAGLV
jgi:hypothetical protein